MAWFDPNQGHHVTNEMIAKNRVDETARRAAEHGPLGEAGGRRTKRGFFGKRLLRRIRGGGD